MIIVCAPTISLISTHYYASNTIGVAEIVQESVQINHVRHDAKLTRQRTASRTLSAPSAPSTCPLCTLFTSRRTPISMKPNILISFFQSSRYSTLNTSSGACLEAYWESAWRSGIESVALALQSRRPYHLGNITTELDSIEAYKEDIGIRLNEDNELERVVAHDRHTFKTGLRKIERKKDY
jgi:hypothetical protein